MPFPDPLALAYTGEVAKGQRLEIAFSYMDSTKKSRSLYLLRKSMGELEKFFSITIEDRVMYRGSMRYTLTLRFAREKAVNRNAWRELEEHAIVSEADLYDTEKMQTTSAMLVKKMMLRILDKKKAL